MQLMWARRGFPSAVLFDGYPDPLCRGPSGRRPIYLPGGGVLFAGAKRTVIDPHWPIIGQTQEMRPLVARASRQPCSEVIRLVSPGHQTVIRCGCHTGKGELRAARKLRAHPERVQVRAGPLPAQLADMRRRLLVTPLQANSVHHGHFLAVGTDEARPSLNKSLIIPRCYAH